MNDQKTIVEEAMKVLEEAEKYLRKYQSPAYKRKLEKLYSNRQAMKRRIRRQEKQFARSLAKHDCSSGTTDSVSDIEIDMEWFLTWRVKLMDFPETMWCDGVQDLQLTARTNVLYYLQAKIWIGPERDVNTKYLCDIDGTIELSQNRQYLKNYDLKIQDDGTSYFARKVI